MIADLRWLLRRVVAPEWRLVTASAILALIGNTLPAIQPILSKQIVDNVVGHGLTVTLVVPVILMSVTFILPSLGSTLEGLPRSTIEERTLRRMDQLVISAGASMPDIAALERPEMHDRIKLMESGVHWSSRWPYMALSALSGLVGVVTLLISLGTLAWWMPLLLLAAAVPHMIGERRMVDVRFKAMRDQSRNTREREYCLTAASDPQLAKEVRAFGLGDFFLRRYDRLTRPALAELSRVRIRSSWISAVGALSYAAAVLISFGYVVIRALAGHLGAGDIALYITGITSLFVALFASGMSLTMLIEATKNITAVRELEAEAKPTITINEPGRPMPARLQDGIRMASVRFGYGTDEATDDAVLRGIDLHLPAGKVTALVGENGEGKSTLVKLLTRMYDPTSGDITADGISLPDYDLRALRDRIATVYQDHGRFSLSFAENIAIGRPELLTPDFDPAEREELIMAAAEKGGADTVLAKLADGLDTELTRRFGGTDLSGGEWQRVATARAFLPDAALIILDEPTSALDVDAERHLFDRFADLVRGRTAVMISHRFSTVRTADQIAVLADGKIAECGSHAELIARGGRYAELFNLQADRYR